MARIGTWEKKHKGVGKSILHWVNKFPEERGSKRVHIIMNYDAGAWNYLNGYSNKVIYTFHTKKDAIDYAHDLMKNYPTGL